MHSEGDCLESYMRQFTTRWYRGLAHLETNLGRIARICRIRLGQRREAWTSVERVLLDRAVG